MEKSPLEKTRLDYKVIFDLITPDSHVLDLGCGDGELLSLLIRHKNCRARGVEINDESILECMEKGITVCHSDIDSSLSEYPNDGFDYVILNESLQEVLHPQRVILEALRIGKKAIVGVPNFCHISAR